MKIPSSSLLLLLLPAAVHGFRSPTTVVRRPASSTRPTIRFATVPEQEDQAVTSTTGTTNGDFAADAFNKVTPSLFDGVPYDDLTIGVLKEDLDGENRVSQTPDTVRNLVKQGFHVIVEEGGE